MTEAPENTITIGERVSKEIEQIFIRLADDYARGYFGDIELSPLELFQAQTAMLAAWNAYTGGGPK